MTLQYRTLLNTSLDQIVDCLVKAFDGYFVPMPSEVSFWDRRFKHARVDKALSWGAFDGEELVGFVINAIDSKDGYLTAYNSGTGVLPAYRGNQIVDYLYEYGVEALRATGVQKCSLEVIDQNEKAIRVYQRIGFRLQYKLFCFKGNLNYSNDVIIKEVELNENMVDMADNHYSWDNKIKTIRIAADSYKMYSVFEHENDHSVGYFIINANNGYIAQLEAKNDNWKDLFEGISRICETVKINNIREDRGSLLSYLDSIGLDNTINQIQMEMDL